MYNQGTTEGISSLCTASIRPEDALLEKKKI